MAGSPHRDPEEVCRCGGRRSFERVRDLDGRLFHGGRHSGHASAQRRDVLFQPIDPTQEVFDPTALAALENRDPIDQPAVENRRHQQYDE
jgi:hypothetical protein